MKFTRNYVSSLIMVALFTGCLTPPEESSYEIDDLLAAPEVVSIGGQNYALETFMWRDFMPITPPGGQPLITIIWVTEVDSLSIPQELNATTLYVINDDEVWETPFSDEDSPPTPEHKLEKVARDGPKWGPDILVTVVVQIKFDGSTYLLKASDQYIGRTD